VHRGVGGSKRYHLDVKERRLGHIDGALPLAVGGAALVMVHVNRHIEEAGGGNLSGVINR
jgi:hypothetical protein